MRRMITALLLFAFSFPLMAPAATVIGASSLPECCRRDGKHHCDKSQSSPSGRQLQTARCAQYPGTIGSVENSVAAVITRVCCGYVALQETALAAASYIRSQSELAYAEQQRGPPSLS